MSGNAEPLLTLTPRERQVLRLSMVGHGRKQIAALLSVTTHTVTDHFKSMYRKLGIRSQGELMSKFISGKFS
jgi:DNA-binding CsgD family transcriptional regulator